MVFQHDGKPATDSFLKFTGDIPTMPVVSVCLKVQLIQFREQNVIISYATPQEDNELTLGMTYTCTKTKHMQ